MKKLLVLSLLFISFSFASFAQEEGEKDESRLQPVAKDWGMSFNISGLISDFALNGTEDQTGRPILFAKHYLKDDLALRLGFGLNTVRNTSTNKDSLRQSGAFVEYDSIFSRNDFSLSFGIEKHLNHMRRIDPFFGGELAMTFIGKENISWNQTITDPSGTTTIEGERKTDGGTGIGVYGIAGFNYFIANHISIGAEYRFGYYYLKTGGNFSESVITTPSSGSPTNVFNKGTDELKSSGFQVSSTASILLSIFF